jgi:glutaredoxin 3
MKIQTIALSGILAMSLLLNEIASFSPADQGGHSASSTTKLHGGLMDFLNTGKKALVKSLAGEYDSVAIRQRLDGLIAQNNVLMLSFTTCPYCIKAKQVLDEQGAKYTVVELDQDPEGKALRAELGDLLGRTSVPAIWIKSEFIGGCNDGGPRNSGVVGLKENGQLPTMLKNAGAITR